MKKLNWNDACRMRDDGLKVPEHLRPNGWNENSLPKRIRPAGRLILRFADKLS